MTPAEAAAWSPLTAHQHAGPRRIVALGAEETPPFHAQAARLHRRFGAGGLDTDLMVQPGLNHMNVVLDLADPGPASWPRILANLVQSAR